MLAGGDRIDAIAFFQFDGFIFSFETAQGSSSLGARLRRRRRQCDS